VGDDTKKTPIAAEQTTSWRFYEVIPEWPHLDYDPSSGPTFCFMVLDEHAVANHQGRKGVRGTVEVLNLKLLCMLRTLLQ
jgi:hypothetical protein